MSLNPWNKLSITTFCSKHQARSDPPSQTHSAGMSFAKNPGLYRKKTICLQAQLSL